MALEHSGCRCLAHPALCTVVLGIPWWHGWAPCVQMGAVCVSARAWGILAAPSPGAPWMFLCISAMVLTWEGKRWLLP